MLFVSLIGIAQNGINYKAIIKDTNGNVIANENITVQFNILQGITQTNVYQETHTPMTNDNGLIVINIGEGTTSDIFAGIDWSADDHFLNVQINTGSGLTDLGTTKFMHVPYALSAANVKGLQAIDEGNGIGWRLISRNPEFYGDIGLDAIDLSYNYSNSTVHGPTANYAATFGFATRASGVSSTAFGNTTIASNHTSTAFGSNTIASGSTSTAMGAFSNASGPISTAMGSQTQASGTQSTATGRLTQALGDYSFTAGDSSVASGISSMAMGSNTLASGDFSTAMGINTRANAYASVAIGRYNSDLGHPNTWIGATQLFTIGNGTSDTDRNNALAVYKSGHMILNSSNNGLRINSEGFFGIRVSEGNGTGIYVHDSNVYGANITGTNAGIRASASASASQNPDIILGGNSSSSSQDDAILSSDPDYPSSDLYLRSYDGVIVELDYNDNESGNFIVRNGDGTDVFSVSEGGIIRQNGTTIHSSDRRLKKDIVNLEYGLDEILQLQPKAYNWRNKEQIHKSLGLIAQEVQPIINEIVVAQDDEAKTLGISYTELIPILIKAIQEQQEVINNQTKTISNQKEINTKQDQQYKALLSRIEILESKSSN